MYLLLVLFFFKQKTAYEMRISDWSSDGCSSDLTTTSAPPSPRSTAGWIRCRTASTRSRRGRRVHRGRKAIPDRRATPARRVPKARRATPGRKVPRGRRAIPGRKVQRARRATPALKVRKVPKALEAAAASLRGNTKTPATPPAPPAADREGPRQNQR